jgi:hypothetical protein
MDRRARLTVTWTRLMCAGVIGAVALWSGSRMPAAAAGDDAVSADAQAQQQAPAGNRQGGRGQNRGGGGGGGGNAPIPFDNLTGFRPIFDGTSLQGWDGDPAFWKVENGAIVGQSTAENPVRQNTFLIWRGGTPADFDLKLEFRLDAGNSGVQYRSQQVPASDTVGNWVLRGYQADIDFANQYTGMLYEERGRGIISQRGMLGYIGPNQPARGRGAAAAPAPGAPPAGPRGMLGALNSADALQAHIKVNDWNQLQIIARDYVLIHVLNGHVTMVFVDDDVDGRSASGLIGLQLHTGPPMKVEFRNIHLRTL